MGGWEVDLLCVTSAGQLTHVNIWAVESRGGRQSIYQNKRAVLGKYPIVSYVCVCAYVRVRIHGPPENVIINTDIC